MRVALFACGLGLVGACSKDPAPPAAATEWAPAPAIASPGPAGARSTPGGSAESIAVPGGAIRAAPAKIDRSLASEEGSLEVIAPPRSPIGTATTARIRVTPGKGFHINTDYPFAVSWTDATGVRLEKTRLTGGKGGEPGDADKLVDGELSIPIALQPTAAGDHTLRGTISFGICRSDQCLTREEPIVVKISSCDTAAAC